MKRHFHNKIFEKKRTQEFWQREAKNWMLAHGYNPTTHAMESEKLQVLLQPVQFYSW